MSQGERKMFLSHEHAKVDFPTENPGPGAYSTVPACGHQPTSAKATAPSWVQGTSERFKYDYVERSKSVPGAGQYEANVAMGDQTLSKKLSFPKYGIGTSVREKRAILYISKEHSKDKHGIGTPGPVTAVLPPSVGKQPDSRKKTAAAWGFGSAQRLVYKDLRKTPGPGAYDYQ